MKECPLTPVDVLIIGAGAAGMMCAVEAGKRGRSVVLLEHMKKPGDKIRISGGGRCNFTNLHCRAEQFISANPHFVKSALAQYSAADFIAMVDSHSIAWHEKTLGQLFCDNRSTDIINMLLAEMVRNGVQMYTGVSVSNIEYIDRRYQVTTNGENYSCGALVIATGGKSIPKMGATGFGYEIAGQFSVGIVDTRPGLVPLTFDPQKLQAFAPLSGTAFDCRVTFGKTSFEEAALFTHRGLSGPALLQISSYWREGEALSIAFLKSPEMPEDLLAAKAKAGRQAIHTWLGNYLPKSLAHFLCEECGVGGRLGDLNKDDIARLTQVLSAWTIRPAGSEGYRTAEVTLGGVDTSDLNSRTLEANNQPGLYFIGEVVDVTGWLGGHNFQWAWSSGWAAGQVV